MAHATGPHGLPLELQSSHRWLGYETPAAIVGYQDAIVINAYVELARKYRSKLASREVPDEWAKQVLAALSVVVSRLAGKRLRVLDVGGAMGLYFDLSNAFLGKHLTIEWTILETPAMVKGALSVLGQKGVAFITSIADAAPEYDLILASGVLQCIDQPWRFLEQITDRQHDCLLVNRMPLIDADRLTVQVVPPSVFNGSYPAWFFSSEKAMQNLTRKHELLMSWPVPEDRPVLDGRIVPYRGFLLKSL